MEFRDYYYGDLDRLRMFRDGELTTLYESAAFIGKIAADYDHAYFVEPNVGTVGRIAH